MKRLLILPLILGAMLAAPAVSNAAADCTPTSWAISGNETNGITTIWGASCNTKWNATLVLQYQDSNGWHTAGCGTTDTNCARNKPNDGGWFTAWSEHNANEDWNVTRPATICTHPFRLRMNFHFFSGAGGITFNGTADNHPCTTTP